MHIPLDRNSPVPLYQQIESYLRECILSGSLAPQTRLPASRQLARDLGVNRITVESAYAELAADGLIYTRVGSGTYILPPYPVTAPRQGRPDGSWPLWQLELPPSRKETYPENSSGENGHEVIHFGPGIGDPHIFPADDFRKAIQAVMRRDGIQALEYGDRRGFRPLRATIAHVLANQGQQTNPDQVLITAGSQQGLALVAQLLLKNGDVVLVENPTYSKALDLFRALRLKIVGIPMDERGMQVERLEELLQQHHPRLIYTIPNFHNPTGACMSIQRRHQLIALSGRYNVPILEDDFVGDLRYEGRVQPSLKAIDPDGRVIYLSTFSKMLMPGLRVGFLVAEGPVYGSLVEFKGLNDLASSNLMQRALENYVTVGRYQAHLQRTVHLYRKRRDAMLAAIKKYMPEGVIANLPQGGLFIWLKLPQGVSADRLVEPACQSGVTISPGGQYFLDAADGDPFMRLNFATNSPEAITEGIQRLGKLF